MECVAQSGCKTRHAGCVEGLCPWPMRAVDARLLLQPRATRVCAPEPCNPDTFVFQVAAWIAIAFFHFCSTIRFHPKSNSTMMKALSLVASAVARASLTSQLLFETLEIVTLRDLRRSFAELKADYGVLCAVLLVFIFPDARYVLKRIQERVLRSQADEKAAIEEVMAFKKSLADDCNMLAVAVRDIHTPTNSHVASIPFAC
jgi:hypothetical protein